MKSPDDGGPAFPGATEYVEEYNPGHPDPLQPMQKALLLRGMTLRDWFAGQALVGMRLPWPGDHGHHKNFAEHAADSAYKVADAMLAERQRRQEERKQG